MKSHLSVSSIFCWPGFSHLATPSIREAERYSLGICQGMEETGFGGHKGHLLSSSSHLCSVALDSPSLEPQLKVANYSAQVTIMGMRWSQCPGYDTQEGVTATDCTRSGTLRGQEPCGGDAAAFLACGLSLSKAPLRMCLLNAGLGEGRPGAGRGARHQPSCRNTMV